MKRIRKEVMETPYRSQIFQSYFDSLSIGVIDIETTGLSPERDRVILGGLVHFTPDKLQFVQYFADGREEEPLLLQEYLRDLNNCDLIVTYHGEGFDLPFLKKRWSRHFDTAFPLISYSLDLYRVVSKHSNLRAILPNLRQKTVEAFLGLSETRQDEISGEESARLYADFLKNRDPRLQERILLHNHDDLLQLSRLLRVLDKLDLHRILFYAGFPVKHEEKRIHIKSIKLQSSQVVAEGIQYRAPIDYLHYSEAYEAFASRHTGEFLLRIPHLREKDRLHVDLTPFTLDHAPISEFPGYLGDKLLIREGDQIRHAELNFLIRLICGEILAQF